MRWRVTKRTLIVFAFLMVITLTPLILINIYLAHLANLPRPADCPAWIWANVTESRHVFTYYVDHPTNDIEAYAADYCKALLANVSVLPP